MRSNVITKICCVILCFLMKYAVEAIEDGLSKPCPAGSYRSEFLFGKCAVCPQLIYCKDQQPGDDQRCKDACAGHNVLSTTSPTTSLTTTPSTTLNTQEPAIPTVVTGKPKSTRPKTENLQKSSSEIFIEVSSEEKADKEISPSRTSKRDESSDGNIMIIGVSCAAAALFIILLGFVIKWCKSRPYSPVSQVFLPESSHVVDVAVATELNDLNSNASSQTESNVGEAEIDEESSWDLQTSLSRNVLNNLTETAL